MTWFRRQVPASATLTVRTYHAQFSESLLSEIFSFIRQSLLTVHP
jgi:hypothetical protein